MKFEKLSTNPSDYLVLDVETNGLSSKQCDLLSVSIYQPDADKIYNRFLPLELNSNVLTTSINGITKKDLKGQKPLSQSEVNQLLSDLDVDHRTILHYGTLDERFIRTYFKRHDLIGFGRMHFFNFKKRICVSRFADVSVTKDNLCNALGIDGVTEVHSGSNDCILEWKLFEKMNGMPLLIMPYSTKSYGIYVLSEDYVIPVSYLQNYENLSKMIERPSIVADAQEIYRIKIKGKNVLRFPTNISGMTIEHLIDVMLDARENEKTMLAEAEWLIANKSKLTLLGKMPRFNYVMPMQFNADGSVTAVNKEDEEEQDAINVVLRTMKKKLVPLVDFIKRDIFHDQIPMTQELVIHQKEGILACCDLSTDDTVLEIKTGPVRLEDYKEQLYYESSGRKTYILGMDWQLKSGVEIYILQTALHAENTTQVKKPLSYIGLTRKMKCGMNATVIEDLGYEDLTVRFEDGLIRQHISRASFNKGSVAHRNDPEKEALHQVKADWHKYMDLPEKLRTKKVTMVCFTGAYTSDWNWNGRRERITFPYKDGSNTRDTKRNINAFIQSIPAELKTDVDIMVKIASSLGLKDFFELYPHGYISTDAMKKLFARQFYGQDYSIFPEKITTREFWEYVYDYKDMEKRKTRPHGFPKDLWLELKDEKK